MLSTIHRTRHYSQRKTSFKVRMLPLMPRLLLSMHTSQTSAYINLLRQLTPLSPPPAEPDIKTRMNSRETIKEMRAIRTKRSSASGKRISYSSLKWMDISIPRNERRSSIQLDVQLAQHEKILMPGFQQPWKASLTDSTLGSN